LYITIEYIDDGYEGILIITFSALKNLIKIKYEAIYYDIEESGFKLIRIKKRNKKNKKKKETKEKDRWERIFGSLKRIQDLFEAYNKKFVKVRNSKKNFLKRLLKKSFLIERLRLNITIGTGDACYTGILAGFAWMAVGILDSLLSQNYNILSKNVNVKTDYMEKKFNLDLFCIFSMRIVHIIIVGMTLKTAKDKS